MVGAKLRVGGCVGDGGGGTRGIVVWAIRHRPDRRGSRWPTMGYTTPDRTTPQRHPTFLTPTREESSQSPLPHPQINIGACSLQLHYNINK